MQTCSMLLAFLLVASCTGQSGTKTAQQDKVISTPEDEVQDPQIGKYLGCFEDSSGKLWVTSLTKGVAVYNGTVLTYLTMEDGLPSNVVLSIAEDKNGALWFGTDLGLSKYEGGRFTNYSTADGLCHPRVANMFFDAKGRMWIGTWGGVCTFDGTTFTSFPLPVPDVELPATLETQNWVTGIMEDSKGNMWFGRSGYGATMYDPVSTAFTQYTKADGIPSNCVQDIQEDDHGNMWFGMRVAERDNPEPKDRSGPGGLARFDGKAFTQFPELPGLMDADVYGVFMDKSGGIWVSTVGNGVYRYDGTGFTNYGLKEGADMPNGPAFVGVTSIIEDKVGRFWFGCANGLFRLDGTGVINVTEDGPWD
jgi:ligand-binding sensor domain-containing protein